MQRAQTNIELLRTTNEEGLPAPRQSRKIYHMVLVVTICVTVFLLGAFVTFSSPHELGGDKTQPANAVGVKGRLGSGVTTEHPTCTRMARDIMKKGGSAIDGTIVALLCIGAINNFSSGIGGGRLHDRPAGQCKGPGDRGDVHRLSGAGPEEGAQGHVQGQSAKARAGGLAVAVPGEIAGMWYAHQRYGRLSWESLFEVVASLAETGFKVTKQLHRLVTKDRREIAGFPDLASLYLDADGEPWAIGHHLKRENLARTLRLIGQHGPDEFYKGSVARSMVETVQKNGGIMDMEDLANYAVKERAVLRQSIDNGSLRLMTGRGTNGGARADPGGEPFIQ